jgi:hypothetical protein
MSAYRSAAAGLASVLDSGVATLTVFDKPVDSVGSFPAAIILPEPVNYEIVFGGNTFEAGFRVVVLLGGFEEQTGFDELYDMLDPTESNKSIVRAIRADPTLNGTVDDTQIMQAENIGRRELFGGFYFGFDLIVNALVTVA